MIGKEKMSEVAIVGDFQCGKSTLFSAFIGGRAISPAGVGVKTTAVPVTAVAIDATKAEFAEAVWRSFEELADIGRFAGNCTLSDSLSDRAARRDFERISLLAARLIAKAGCSMRGAISRWPIDGLALDKLKGWISYPEGWEERWERDPSGGDFDIEEAKFLLLKRVVVHVHSEILSRLDCAITDTPGFNESAWDDLLAREAVAGADLSIWVVDALQEKATVAKEFLRQTQWFQSQGLGGTLRFAMNAKMRKDGASLAKIKTGNEKKLCESGLLSRDESITVINAFLASSAAFESGCGGGELDHAVLKILEEWEGLDSHDPAQRSTLMEIARNRDELVKRSGLLDLVATLSASLNAKRRACKAVENSHLIGGEKCAPAPGYGWIYGDSYFTQMWFGAAWKAGTCHPKFGESVIADSKEGWWRLADGYTWDGRMARKPRRRPSPPQWTPGLPDSTTAHVVATEEEGRFIPEDGYDWLDASSVESRWRYGVAWKPGIQSQSNPHLVADVKEGRWKRSATRTRKEIEKALSHFSHEKFFIGRQLANVSKKVWNACQSMRVRQSEEVIALYDNVWLRQSLGYGGCDGFVVTTGGVYAKAAFNSPSRFGWEESGTIRFKRLSADYPDSSTTVRLGNNDPVTLTWIITDCDRSILNKAFKDLL